jgi:hypothetical protein
MLVSDSRNEPLASAAKAAGERFLLRERPGEEGMRP